jgi:hypothetical protein
MTCTAKKSIAKTVFPEVANDEHQIWSQPVRKLRIDFAVQDLNFGYRPSDSFNATSRAIKPEAAIIFLWAAATFMFSASLGQWPSASAIPHAIPLLRTFS